MCRQDSCSPDSKEEKKHKEKKHKKAKEPSASSIPQAEARHRSQSPRPAAGPLQSSTSLSKPGLGALEPSSKPGLGALGTSSKQELGAVDTRQDAQSPRSKEE